MISVTIGLEETTLLTTVNIPIKCVTPKECVKNVILMLIIDRK
mgnify:CR=1 FL=1